MRLQCQVRVYLRAAGMQCCESEKPVKAVWHDLTCTVNAKLDFVNFTKLFQTANKRVGIKRDRILPHMDDTVKAVIVKPRLLFEYGSGHASFFLCFSLG